VPMDEVFYHPCVSLHRQYMVVGISENDDAIGSYAMTAWSHPKRSRDDVLELAAGLAMVKMQLGGPGAIRRIERCGGESAPSTMVAEEQPPRMRMTCDQRDQRCAEDS
jgi:hypothetical protein